MVFRHFIRVLLLLILSNALIGQETDKKVQFSGFGELDHISFFKGLDGKVNGRNQAAVFLDFRAALNKRSSFKATGELRADLSDKSRNRFFLEEAYIDYFAEKFDLRIGRQLVKWGEADAVNPTNNFSPVDLSDLLDSEEEELPIFGIRTKYFLEEGTIDFILSPVFTQSIFPTHPRNRWGEDFPSRLPHPLLDTSITTGYQILEDQRLGKYKFGKNLQLGIRYSFLLPNWDVSVSLYSGPNDLPKFRQVVGLINIDSLQVDIIPEFYRWNVLGGDFSTTLGTWGLRGEAALFLSNKSANFPKADPPFFSFIAGIDRTFLNVYKENNLFVIAQWSQEAVFGDPFPAKDINHIFRQALILRMEQDAGPFAKAYLQFAYDTKFKGWYVQPKFSYNLTDGLKLEGMIDILGGNKDSFFGSYKRNARFQVRMRYNF